MVRRTSLSLLPGHALGALLATRLLSGHFSGFFFVLSVRWLLTHWVKCHGSVFKGGQHRADTSLIRDPGILGKQQR